jgi:hypothetical protein
VSRRIAFSFAVAVASTLAQGPLPSAPESLAGRWEAPDGRGGFVGMNISLSRYFNPAANGAAPPNRAELVIAVYKRDETSADPAGYNFFSTGPGGGARWDGHRLSADGSYPLSINIDLVWNGRSQTWDGLFNRDDFRQSVSLKKPITAQSENLFTGTWVNPAASMMNSCLHIARQHDGTLTAWSDDVEIRAQNPPRTVENYGEIGKVVAEAANQITVTLRAETGGCCPLKFSAMLSSDGTTLTGDWIPGPNSPRGRVRWLRVAGKSCLREGR